MLHMETKVIQKKEVEELKITDRKVMRTILGSNITKDRRSVNNKEKWRIRTGIKTHKDTQTWFGHTMKRKSSNIFRGMTQWYHSDQKEETYQIFKKEDLRALRIVDWETK